MFHHLQNDFTTFFIFYFFGLLFKSTFVTNVVIFLFKSVLCLNPEIPDLSTNIFYITFVLSISHVNLL